VRFAHDSNSAGEAGGGRSRQPSLVEFFSLRLGISCEEETVSGKFLPLGKGLPCHDTFSRLFRLLDPDALRDRPPGQSGERAKTVCLHPGFNAMALLERPRGLATPTL